MRIEPIEEDARDAAKMLVRARRIGRVGSIVTFGLWRNIRGIEHAQSLYASAQEDLVALRLGVTELAELRQRISEWEDIRGVRVAKYAFPDLLLDGRQTYGADWQALRLEILERDSFSCQHIDGACRGPLQIHHIIWLSQGGSNDPQNLVTLCRFHHGLQHPDNPAFTGD